MKTDSLAQRRALATQLRDLKHAIAREVTRVFLERHADWLERYQQQAVVRGEEDAVFHLEFLAAALEAGSRQGFEQYTHWCAGMLEARGMARQYLIEFLELLGSAIARLVPVQAELVNSFIQSGCAAVPADAPAPPPPSQSPLAAEQRLFLQALLTPHRKTAAQIALETLRNGHSIEELYSEILQESLYEVGRRWESNQISVAQEHMATAIAQSVMAMLYERIEPPPTPRGKMVVTGVQGELHQVGANMVADVLEADGWDVVFLGTNTPHSGVLASVKSHGAKVLGISATVLSNLPQVVRLVETAREQFGEQAPRILVGGAAFRCTPELAEEIHADAVGLNLSQALAAARRWSS